MKKFFSLLGIISLIVICNCSRIPENDDPILGIWAQTDITTTEGKQTTQREEWIFNDAYLGRYHSFNNEKLEFYTDFSWTIENDIYTIQYRGADIPEAKVKLIKVDYPEILQLENGALFATRE